MSDVFTTKEVLVSHPNARLTVRGRQLIVERSRAGWSQAHIAADVATEAQVYTVESRTEFAETSSEIILAEANELARRLRKDKLVR